MSVLLQGRSEKFKKQFCGTHYFNPPRYMHLLEIIPTSFTAPEVLKTVNDFQQRILGKGIVIAKDVPGFVANRLGVHGMVVAGRFMMEYDLTIGEVDTLTGALIARAKTATFRTGDLSGIDVLVHVTKGLSEATGEDFALAPWILELVKSGRLGDKTKAGFYNKQGKDILTLDWKTLAYEKQERYSTPEIEALLKLPAAERVNKAKDLGGKQGDFLRKLLVEQSHYCLTMTPQLAYDLSAVDRATEWGYGWEIGPFKVMDALGLDWLRAEFKKAGKDEPPLLKSAGTVVLRTDARGHHDRHRGQGPHSAPAHPRTALALDTQAARQGARGEQGGALRGPRRRRALPRVLRQDEHARARRAGDAREDDRSSLRTESTPVSVLGNDDPRTFSAGANLGAAAGAAAAGDWKAIEASVKAFQDSVMSVRRAPFPVVSAPFGLTLGGGVEFSLHADRIQAHAELYMGLVEVGVGIIPSGCGTKELLFRFTEALKPYDDADPFEAAKRAFKLIALAQMSTSASEARKMGFLRPVADRISFNRDTLIADAKARVLDLAPDYVAPAMKTIRVLGNETFGNLKYALFSFKEAGQASDHDVRIGTEIAYVLAGGDGPPRDATEQDIIDLEREATLKLLGTKETQARIKYMLETGKPLRN